MRLDTMLRVRRAHDHRHQQHSGRVRFLGLRRGRRTVVGALAWTWLLGGVAVLSNGCGVDCESACEEAVERCGGTIGYEYITRGLCADYCDRGGSWGECFDCMNEERSCDGLRCLRDESCRDRHGVFKGGEG